VTSVVNAIYDEYPNADSISSGERRSTTTEGQYRERERERKRKRKREKKARKYARRHEINDESFSTGCGIFVLLLYF
jgi:hypothetical protein